MMDLPEISLIVQSQVGTYGDTQLALLRDEMVAAAEDRGMWGLVFDEPFTRPESYAWVVTVRGYRPITDGPVLNVLDLYHRWEEGMPPIGWLY